MQKNECRCKLTLGYTRFSIRFRRFRKQIPQTAKKESVLLCEYNDFLAECFYSLQPLFCHFTHDKPLL